MALFIRLGISSSSMIIAPPAFASQEALCAITGMPSLCGSQGLEEDRREMYVASKAS
jgi:hypothetical protein